MACLPLLAGVGLHSAAITEAAPADFAGRAPSPGLGFEQSLQETRPGSGKPLRPSAGRGGGTDTTTAAAPRGDAGGVLAALPGSSPVTEGRALLPKALGALALGLVALAAWNWRLAKEGARRRQVEAARLDSEKRARLLAEASFEGIAVTEKGVLVDCSDQMVQMLGGERSTLLGRPVMDFIAPADRERVAEAERAGRLETYEHSLLRVDGTEIPVEARARSAQIAGRWVRVTAVRDITEQRLAKQTLQLSQYSIDQASDAVFWMNREGGFAYVNDQACRSLGYSRDELLQLRLWDIDRIFPKDLWFERWGGYQQDRRGGAEILETFHTRKDGSSFPVEVVAKHLWLGEAEVHVCFVRDITERKRAEQILRTSEAFLDTILEQSPHSMWVSDAAGTVVRMNQACRDLLHARDEELIGKYNILHDNIVEEQGVMPLVRRVFERGERVHFTLRYDSSQLRTPPLAAAVRLILEVTISPVLDDQGRVVHAIIQHVDVTERTLAHEEFQRLANEHRTVLNAVNIGISYLKNRKHQWVNPAFAAMFGRSSEETTGMDALEFYVHEEDYRRVGREGYACLARAEDYVTEALMKRKDGSPFWCSITGQAINPANLAEGTIWTLQDVTERKQAETALRESESRFRQVVECSPMPMGISNPSGRIEYINPRFEETFGYSLDEVADVEHWFQLAYPDAAYRESVVAQWKEAIDRAMRDRRPSEVLGVRIVCRDGSVRIMQVFGAAMGDRLLVVFNDLTERIRSEDALRESEQRFAVFMANLPAGAFMKDVPGAVVYANRYLCELFGWGSVLGRSTRELLPPEVAEKMEAEDRDALTNGLLTVVERIRDVTGRERIFQTSKFPIARAGSPPLLGGIAVEITERKQAEEALRSSLEEKVILLKEVHHRVKNNLQIVASLLNLQGRKVQSPEVQAFLRETQGRIRAMSLLHETLYGSGHFASASFREYLKNLCAQVARSYSSDTRNIQLRQEVAEVGLPLDQAVPAGLILNELLSNAFKHAFTGRSQGVITVQLLVVDERHCVLRVADDGVGLPESAPSRAAGTLGLRLVEGLVRQLDGELTVSRDQGTRFQVTFPVAHPETLPS